MKLNRSRYAILGLLSRGPSSGYDIRKTVEHELSHFWNESFGQIYPILRSLAAERLASRKRQRQKGKPDRYVYSITESGRRELQAWLTEPSRIPTERNEILLKLFLSESVGRGERISLISTYREQQKEALRELELQELALEKFSFDEREENLWKLTASHVRSEAKARVRWCDEALRELSSPGEPSRQESTG